MSKPTTLVVVPEATLWVRLLPAQKRSQRERTRDKTDGGSLTAINKCFDVLHIGTSKPYNTAYTSNTTYSNIARENRS